MRKAILVLYFQVIQVNLKISGQNIFPVLKLLNDNNFSINNIDINLICENPKVSKIRNKIINSLSRLLSINRNLINLKVKL